jgi:hypothetical protein
LRVVQKYLAAVQTQLSVIIMMIADTYPAVITLLRGIIMNLTLAEIADKHDTCLSSFLVKTPGGRPGASRRNLLGKMDDFLRADRMQCQSVLHGPFTTKACIDAAIFHAVNRFLIQAIKTARYPRHQVALGVVQLFNVSLHLLAFLVAGDTMYRARIVPKPI